MKPAPPDRLQVDAPTGPLLRPDYRERLRALLPELIVSIVAATGVTAAMTITDDTDLAALVTMCFMAQLFTQTYLYFGTYLLDFAGRPRLASLIWLLYIMCTPLPSMVTPTLSHLLGPGFRGLGLAASMSGYAGLGLFCLTRVRWTLVLTVIEILLMGDVVDRISGFLPLHVVTIAAVAVLYLMRSSATRITLLFDAGGHRDAGASSQNAPSTGLGLGMFAQVTLLALAAAALCLVVSLAGTLPLVLRSGAQGFAASAPAETSQEVPPAEGEQAEQTPSGVQQESSDTEQEPSGAGQAGRQEGGAQDTAGNASRSSSLRDVFALLSLLVLAMLPILPFVARLLLRAHARRALERNPDPSDRAARLYLAILARLEAAGIARDEAETPVEFLSAHEEELGAFTAPAGLGLDAWRTLTDTYEQVRYAGLEPTEAELATCWRLYDAMPHCARAHLGWLGYVLGAFWRM